MKKLCFIEMEGVLSSFGQYVPNQLEVNNFLSKVSSFCKDNKIDLYLVSGYHELVAKRVFAENNFNTFFDENHFLCVDDVYISNKTQSDKDLHLKNLEKNSEFCDSFFKQVIIQQFLKKFDLNERDALLLGDDVWTDGYYTSRFSKIDFAIFEGNIVDRGKIVERLSGLAYFSLEFDSVKQLLTSFPEVSLVSLEKYVFEVMKEFLVGDSVKDSIKNAVLKKKFNLN